MTARLGMLCACGLIFLGGQALGAQSSTNAGGPTVGRLAASNSPEGPRPGTITGVPYSATTERESSQTLADGTHIEQKPAPEEKTYRDSLGRTRRERYFPANFGGVAPQTLQSIMISDPVRELNII